MTTPSRRPIPTGPPRRSMFASTTRPVRHSTPLPLSIVARPHEAGLIRSWRELIPLPLSGLRSRSRPSGLFLPAIAFTPPLERQSSLAVGFLVDRAGGCFFGLARSFLGLWLPSPSRCVGRFASSLDPVRSDWAPENNTGFGHGRGDDVWVFAFLCHALTEEIAVGVPCLQSRLHRSAPNARS